MNKLYLLLALTFAVQAKTLGQERNTTDQTNNEKGIDRWVIGGDLAASFGSITYINISPRIGYRINNKLTGGLGVVYNYLSDNRFKGFEFSNYGGLIFANYAVLPELMLVAEFQNLSVERYSEFSGMKIRVPVNVLFVGGAYTLQLGGKSFGYISLLYDVFEDINSPYSNPYLGGGILFRL